jgi:diketogulonate reductase-like aldo/keto reductase
VESPISRPGRKHDHADAVGSLRRRNLSLQQRRPLRTVSLRRLLEDPVISAIAARVGKTPAQVLLAWAVQRATALLARARENFDISSLPEDAFNEISRIQTRQRLNEVVKTGVPGFIAQGSRT